VLSPYGGIVQIKIDTPQRLDQLINGMPGGGIFDSNTFLFSPAMEAVHAAFNHGVALANEGELDRANAVYSQILETYPTFVAARFNLATNLRRVGETEAARQHIEIALRYGDTDHDVFTAAGIIYGELGDQLAEVDMYQRAHRLSPGSTDPLFFLVITYRQLELWTVARGWLEILELRLRPYIGHSLTPVSPSDVEKLEWNWGLIYEHFGNWSRAAAHFEATYALNRQDYVLTKANAARRRAGELGAK